MAYHNGDGCVSIHHPDDSFHSNELCRRAKLCFANMVCTMLQLKVKKSRFVF